MDFFKAQDIARKQTTRLVVLFALSIVSLLILTNLLVMATMGLMSVDEGPDPLSSMDWTAFFWVSIAVLAVVGLGSLIKIMSLRGGGARVAEMLNARLVQSGSNNLHEQRVLNVVEEMAIASGTPVPPVYIMEESAINAFAAGYSPSDAVIGVTRGAIEKLDREQLQGVIAHEFSHILHGDMRLNIKLMGWLHGIMVLGIMGYYLMRTAGMSRRSKEGNGLVIMGLGLVVIGAAGTFFGKLIKAAVSRQREFLADASAVQYTRSAHGIAGALKRIGGDAQGSLLDNPATPEISHSLFSSGINVSIQSLFATHPPLQQRIKKLQPDWNGQFDTESLRRKQPPKPAKTDSHESRNRSATALGVAVAAAMTRVGNPDAADISEAHRVHSALDPELLSAAHEPHGARALIYLLLLDREKAGRIAQLNFLAQAADTGVYHELQKLLAAEKNLKAEDRLALVNISLASLRQLSPAQYQLFSRNMSELIVLADNKGLRQWLIHNLVSHHLLAVFSGKGNSVKQVSLSQSPVQVACATLLSLLTYLGELQGVAAAAAFEAARSHLNISTIDLIAADSLSLVLLDDAVKKLAGLPGKEKILLLEAMAICIQHDGKLTVSEQELFRTVSEIIDCPMPALL
jgi:Zn-dependent protease with chaperone function